VIWRRDRLRAVDLAGHRSPVAFPHVVSS